MEFIISSMDPSLNLASGIEQIAAGSGTGCHVLIADDSSSIRNTIAGFLEQADFKVTKVTCGREAWEQLKEWERLAQAGEEKITDYVDLVISDIEMPELDGHTLTKMIKEDPVLKKLPVILFSSLISDVVRKKGDAAGADDQIAKPDLAELTQRAQALIRKSQEE